MGYGSVVLLGTRACIRDERSVTWVRDERLSFKVHKHACLCTRCCAHRQLCRAACARKFRPAHRMAPRQTRLVTTPVL